METGNNSKRVITVSLEEQGIKRTKTIKQPYCKKTRTNRKLPKSSGWVREWMKSKHPHKFNGSVIVTRNNGKREIEDNYSRRFFDYDEYLRSEHWKQVKKRIKIQRGGRCEGCNIGFSLHVHHGSYANLGKERDTELFLVCERCHHKIHEGFDIPAERPNHSLMKRTKNILKKIQDSTGKG